MQNENTVITNSGERYNQIIEQQPQQIEDQPQIEQQNNIEEHQNVGTQNRPNYIERQGYVNNAGGNRDYGHYLQEGGDYYTYNGQMNRNQIHEYAAPEGQTDLPIHIPNDRRKGHHAPTT